ncbi:hypothetical protein ACFDR9_002396, partial [Janthinobacterium sp. CG_23.3]|uniref:hypothetical protein n=1 Tax=Janthinobacterium sp. CG_23.3 TaxID=3349634 RepID=UPI0038D4D9DB
CIEFDFGHRPRRLQAQRACKQGFNGNTHQAFFVFKMAVPAMVLDVKFHTKRHRAILAASTRFNRRFDLANIFVRFYTLPSRLKPGLKRGFGWLKIKAN